MPEDALAAEKPSFNRGPDGRTPFGVPLYRSRITALADEAMQCSGRGQYMLAQSTHDQIAGVVEDEKAHRVEEEKVRQREERLKLDRAYRIEKERFEAEWAERARLYNGVAPPPQPARPPKRPRHAGTKQQASPPSGQRALTSFFGSGTR